MPLHINFLQVFGLDAIYGDDIAQYPYLTKKQEIC
jgi:hypothetical protein